MWIVNKKIDLFFILFPGVLIIPFLLLISEENPLYLVLVLVILALLDKGHVYTTVWRTIFRKSDQRTTFFIIPVLCFIFLFAWLSLDIPYFWAMIVYVTVFHNVRQFYGFTRWYQKKAKYFSVWPPRFVYAFTILPFAAFHFQKIPQFELYYSGEDIFFFNFPLVFNIILVGYLIILAGFLMYVFSQWKHKKRRAVMLSVFSAAMVYGYSFFLGQTTLQVLGPLIVAHACSYYVAMSESLKKLTYNTYLKPIALVLSTAILFGVAEFFIDEGFFSEIIITEISLLVKLAMALLFVPLITHYVYDMLIWKASNKDFQKILR